MEMPSLRKSIISRMNFNEDSETIFLLEDNGIFDISNINVSSRVGNEFNYFFNKINVKYENLFEVEEGEYLIKDLNKYYDFIKVIYNYENKKNEIYFLILKNKNYSDDNILQKINDKAIFGNEIKEILKIDSFPINDYYLEEQQSDEDDKDQYIKFDKIYILKKLINKNKIKSILNISNIIDTVYDKLIEKINDLDKKMDDMEQNINNKILQLDTKLENVKSLVTTLIEIIINKNNNKI